LHIRTVTLRDIKGFGSGPQGVELDLRRPDGTYAGWTVLAGPNGSGKTTLLQAIALAVVGPDAARVMQDSYAGWVHSSERRGQIVLDLDVHHLDWFMLDEDTGHEQPLPLFVGLRFELKGPLETERAHLSHEPVLSVPANLPSHTRPKEAALRRLEGPWNPNPKGWFLAGYGPYRRLSGGNAVDDHSRSTWTARIATLFKDDAALAEAVSWLQLSQFRHLEELHKTSGRGGKARQLKEVIFELLNDDLLPPGTRVVDVDSEGLWVERGGVVLPLQHLSDGYRGVTSLILDIVRQLHRQYLLKRPLPEDDPGVFLREFGVVLIDEVETHLHVTWQKKLGFWLKEHFPNIQFIVTTHSPFVCQAADPGGLIRVSGPGDERATGPVAPDLYATIVNGGADEAAMSELFGLPYPHSERSERLQSRLAEIEARILKGAATEREQREREELLRQLPDSPSAQVARSLAALEKEL
jgi:energy-coupling factor transporter ATP-binding protein EcfA2